MKTLKNLEHLQQLHNLIEERNTGTPAELATRMHISERKVYHLLDQLRDFEANICYSRKSKSYYYCNDFELRVSISVTVMSNNELIDIFGGSYFLKENPSLQALCSERNYIYNIKTKLMRIEHVL